MPRFLGYRIKERRLELGMSANELAAAMAALGAAKTQEPHISIWENEKSVPRADVLDILKQALKVKSIDYFFNVDLRD